MSIMDVEDRLLLDHEQAIIRRVTGEKALLFLREFALEWLHDHALHRLAELRRSLDYRASLRGRKPAYNFAKIGSLVFGPPLPDGDGTESVYRIEQRKGKQQILRTMHDGRATDRELGKTHHWHADDNIAVFGVPVRGELVKYRNDLKRRGLW